MLLYFTICAMTPESTRILTWRASFSLHIHIIVKYSATRLLCQDASCSDLFLLRVFYVTPPNYTKKIVNHSFPIMLQYFTICVVTPDFTLYCFNKHTLLRIRISEVPKSFCSNDLWFQTLVVLLCLSFGNWWRPFILKGRKKNQKEKGKEKKLG